MPLLSAGQSATVSLAVGERLNASGSGVISVIPPTNPALIAQSWTISDPYSSVGPFQWPVSLSVQARSPVNYSVLPAGVSLPVDSDGTPSYANPALSSRLMFAGIPGNVLTGGTTGVKTTLLELPLEDDLFRDFKGVLLINAGFLVTKNTNTKRHGIDIGLTAGTAVTLRTRSVTSASIGADGYNIELQRHPVSSDQLGMTLGGALATWGTTNVDTTSVVSVINVSPESRGLKLFFWGQLDTANTDSVTLGSYRVYYQRAEA